MTPLLPPGTRIGLFIRVSTDDQVRNESPEVHLQRGQEYTDGHGWIVVAVYQLDGVSGASMMNEPDTKRMWRDVESGVIDALLFSAVARMGRNMFDLFKIERHLRAHDKWLVDTRRGVIDTDTQEGLDYFFHSAHRAHSERLELSARVKAGLITRAKMGQFVASLPPYGYKKVPAAQTGKAKKLEIDPIEGPIRVLMYDLYLQHRKFMIVAAELNRRGYRNRNGKPFSLHNVRAILLDSSAMGVYYSNRTAHNNPTGKTEADRIPIPVPQLIDGEKWERVKSLIESNLPKVRRAIYPYSGLLNCICGPKMYTNSSMNNSKSQYRYPPRYSCRQCGNRIRMNLLDEAIGVLFTGFLLDGVPDGVEVELSKTEQQLLALKSELKNVIAGKNRWADAYQAGALELDDFKKYHSPLIERERELTTEISCLEQGLRTDKDQLQAQEQAVQVFQSASWSDLTTEEKHALLREFVQSIILGPENITIKLLYTPAALQVSEPGLAKLHKIIAPRPDHLVMPNDQYAWSWLLHRERKARGEATRKVSTILGIHETTINHWEKMSRPPGPTHIAKIMEYLGYIPWVRTPYAQDTLGAAFRTIREALGVTQLELSNKLRISQAAISKVERGEVVSVKLLNRIEMALKVPVRQIYRAYQPEN